MSGSLANSPADIVRELIIDKGWGSDPDLSSSNPVYSEYEPGTPENLITVFNTAGRTNQKTQYGITQGSYGIQIMIRGKHRDTIYSLSNTIKVGLDVLSRVTVPVGTNNYLIHSMFRVSDILDLGKEVPSTGLHRMTLNYLCYITQT